VANRRPPLRAALECNVDCRSCGLEAAAGVWLASVRSNFPLESNTSMSGVKGFAGSNSPLPKFDCSLHLLGNPCPDSSTYTSKFCLLPRNAIPVGKLRPALKTETVKPGGTTMSLPEFGSNSAVLDGHSGLETVAADESAGIAKAGASINTDDMTGKRNKELLMAVLSA